MIKFEKWQGLGNDFIILEENIITPTLAKELCNRQFGIGADGIFAPVSSKIADIGWNFYIDKGNVAFYVVTPHFLFVSVLFSEDDNYLFSDIRNIQDTGYVNTNIRMTPDLLKMLKYLGNKNFQTIGKVFKNKKKIQEKLDKNPDYIKSNTYRIFKKGSLWK